jgi:uncharacterized protein (TIGR00159 family)
MLQVFSELRWQDALDILIVAALVYAVILWLRRSQASLVALGLALLSLVYVGARLLGLQLTTLAFQSLFAVSIVVLVVIFQEELRQAFEELAGWVLRRHQEVRPRFDTRGVLVEWLFRLARQRRGALMVIPGRQLLDRHLQGGVELDGRLSGALLQSLFDPHSDGHDGAVVVENRPVTRFGVHLPLSRNTAHLGSLGTRHSAALGLAERTDALCLAVSEERGEISAALNGVLKPIASAQQLGLLIDLFFKDRHPLLQHRPLLARLLSQNGLAKGVSLASAAFLWALLVPGSDPAQVTLPIRVEVSGLPDKLELEKVEPQEVTATFKGTRRDLISLDGEALRLQVDASLAKLGRRTFEISERNVSHPGGMVLTDLYPDKVRISVR